jgi:hypothetical protein
MKKMCISAALAAAGILMLLLPQISMAANQVIEVYNAKGDPLKFKTDQLDIGEVPQGKPVTVEFEYSNDSKETVIIANASTACGCTVAGFDKNPIQPGKTGKISVSYNAAALGVFSKTVTVSFDNGVQKILTLKGKVV